MTMNIKSIWKYKYSLLLAILYTIIVLFQKRFSTQPNASAINGSLMIIQMMLLSLQMIITKDKWFWVCMIGSFGQLFMVCMSIFVLKQKASIPGAVIAIGVILYQVIIHFYIKKQEESKQKLKTIAVTDKLTGLFNRYGFEEEINNLIQTEQSFYLFYIDLDNFKYVNDTLGHDAGDEVLQKAAKFWSEMSSFEYQTVSRLGGDEFALVLKTNKEKIARSIAKEILRLNENYDPLLRNISVSVGMVNYPKDAKDKKTLLSYADSAMYKAKTSGKNTVQYFDKNIHNDIVQEYDTKIKIKDAIHNKQFEMYYQPQYCTDNEKIYGFESLIRLNIDGENIPTQYFINIAEKDDTIFEIDNFVLDKVTKDWAPFIRGKKLKLSVNISGKHLVSNGFVEEVVTILTRNNFPPQNLCIEITESSFVKSIVLAKNTVDKLRTIGIKIALDDFGTKYSSLKYLQNFASNHIKIEKAFTDTIKVDTSDDNIVNIIISIAHLLNCEVIAEGVETQEQIDYLKKYKCDIIQGYYYSKPLPFKEAITCI